MQVGYSYVQCSECVVSVIYSIGRANTNTNTWKAVKCRTIYNKACDAYNNNSSNSCQMFVLSSTSAGEQKVL